MKWLAPWGPVLPETDTTWPVTELYESLAQWVATRMRADHRDPDGTR